MKVKVSKTVKMLYGRQWRKEIKSLIEAALAGSEGKTLECRTIGCTLMIDIIGTKKGVTVTACPDLLPELEECEL
jgi:hypothetical protein